MATRWILSLAACLFVLPSLSAAPADWAVAENAFIESLATPAPEPRAGNDDEAGASRAFVTVDCWDGTTRSCSGSTVRGYDSACPSQRGYCYGSSTGYRYCPACPPPTCPSSTPCSNYYGTGSCSPNGGQRSCTYFSGECGTCYCIGGSYWDCV